MSEIKKKPNKIPYKRAEKSDNQVMENEKKIDNKEKVNNSKADNKEKVNNSKIDNKEKVSNQKIENKKKINNQKIENKKKINNQQIEDKDNHTINTNEAKYDTVSLKEIREAIENKINEEQKQSLVKKILINIGIAVIMILYLVLIIMGSKNIDVVVLEKDVKILSLCILAIGIFVLEMAYKKDNNEMAINSLEILVFGTTNLCLIYVIKLYFSNLISTIIYISGAIACYYTLKSIILGISDVRKYKKDNNDIKEIIKK